METGIIPIHLTTSPYSLQATRDHIEVVASHVCYRWDIDLSIEIKVAPAAAPA